jgi:RNA polymerase sigma-70 factor (ECF subfamily)
MLGLSGFCVYYYSMKKEQFIEEVVPLYPKLMEYALQFLKNKEEAEDAVQEIMLKLYEMRSRLTEYKSIYALSLSMLKHLCLNLLRDSKDKFKDKFDTTLASGMPTPLVQLEQKEDVALVTKLISRLPNLQRAILKMKHIEDLSVDEIAEITGSRPEAVRMNLSRSRKQIINHFLKIQGDERRI